MATEKAFLLNCAVQSYAWGKLGIESAVATLSQGGNDKFDLKDTDPYAELWMGTHPKAPSVAKITGEPLSEWLKKNPKSIGAKVLEKFPSTGQLPFLFKVLSVNKALSIQAHPNKGHAEKLHAERPSEYPDPNHKPEMAIALTQFEGLCGFRPAGEIADFFKRVPELKEVVGPTLAEAFIASTDTENGQKSLRDCFSALMSCEQSTIQSKLCSLVKRIESLGENSDIILGDLVLRLNSQFPGDVGCFCVYFLNRMKLDPGDAMFLEANLPHAYLAGDCIECMACSDNVVRAGLTPKFKDVPTLCSMLNYEGKPATENLFTPASHPSDAYVTIYNPPIPDFAVAKIKLPEDFVGEYQLEALGSASIVLIFQGQADSPSHGLNLKKGSVIYISASESVKVNKTSKHDVLMFRAYCDL